MRLLLIFTALGALLIAVGLWLMRGPGTPARAETSLQVFCAAGLRLPIEAAAKRYEAATGIAVRLEYGGSGDLETRLSVAKRGDLYLPADASFTTRMRERGQVREIIPLATQAPVLAVAKGNPKAITNLAQARQPGIRLGVPNPESASLGKLVKKRLGDDWTLLQSQLAVTKPTVNEVATDLVTGSLDAAILWDATVQQFPGSEALPLPELGDVRETITAGVLAWSAQPTEALRFARFLASPEEGNPIFTAHGYVALAGDRWALAPEVSLFSGAVNRVAIQGLIDSFAAREGVRVTTTFNGCGILCATMLAMEKGAAGAFPDGYYACDICFVPPVARQFPEAVLLTSTEIVIAVAKGNPKAIGGLADLAREGLRIGVCNAEQSTLGFMTGRMLQAVNLKDAIMRNARSQVPTGDLLVNQLLTGSLDAAIVYRVNAHHRDDKLTVVPITGVPAVAVQPYAIWRDSPHKQLMQRFLDHLRSNGNAFTDQGFTWSGDSAPVKSADLPIPPWLQGAGHEF